MTGNDLKKFREWYASYAESFSFDDKEDRKNILVKVDHTYNVCNNIVEIARGLNLGENEVRLAETAPDARNSRRRRLRVATDQGQEKQRGDAARPGRSDSSSSRSGPHGYLLSEGLFVPLGGSSIPRYHRTKFSTLYSLYVE